MSEFFFMRHGQSQANVDGVLADQFSPLTEKGIDQARMAGQKLLRESITKIVCSPFLRTRQTAETVARELGIDPTSIETIGALRERNFGKLINQPKIHPTEWYIHADAPTVEPAQVVLDRMTHCLHILEKEAEGETLLVIGHAMSGFYLEQAALGKTTLASFDALPNLDNAEVVHITLPPLS